MKIRAFQINQNGKIFYTSSMKIKDLVGKVKVDEWHKVQNGIFAGYQRGINLRRAKEFSGYISEGSICPTPLLINIRENGVNFRDGIVSIPENSTFWLVDGQHRMAGFEHLLETNGSFENFEVPVIIINEENFDEATQFYVINMTQKGVRSDLAERYLEDAVRVKGRKYLMEKLNKGILKQIYKDLQWGADIAVKIADNLNESEDSIWYKMIQIPNAKSRGEIAKQRSFTQSLKPVLMDDNVIRQECDTPDEIANVVKNYWNAIAELCKEAFGDKRKKYVIQKYLGMMALNGVLPTMAARCWDSNKQTYNFSKEKFKDILSHQDEIMSADYWESKNRDGAGGLGSNKKAVRQLMTEIKNRLPPGKKKAIF